MKWRSWLPVSVREWLTRGHSERELANLREHYSQRERGVLTDDDRHAIDADWSADAEWPENELYDLKTRRLHRQADRWDVDMPGFRDGAWIVNDPHTGHTYLQPPEQKKLKRQIKLARRESIRWWIQTVIMPLIALGSIVVGLLSLLLSWYRLNVR